MKSLLTFAMGVLALSCMMVNAEARGGHGDHYRGGWGGHHYGHHRGHHSRFSFNFGVPLGWGYGPHFGPRYFAPRYYPPYYVAPAPVIIQQEPTVYIQRQPVVVAPPVAAAPQAAVQWHYCPAPAGYYPHVQNCTQAWVAVDPASVAPPR